MLNKQNYIAILIPYLTICCGFYHLIYWGQFGLNGLALITISDIIKSAAGYLALAILFALGVALGYEIANRKVLKKKNKIAPETENENYTFLGVAIDIFFTGVIPVLFFILLNYFFNFSRLNFFIMITVLIGGSLIEFVNINFLFAKDFNTRINKKIILLVLIYFPCFSAIIAFDNAMSILDNKSYKYLVRKGEFKNQDTLKFIGITEKNFVFTDMGNKNLYFLQQDSMTLHFK